MPKNLDAGPLEAEVQSFALRMAAEGKAPRTVRAYTEAVRWFAAAHILPETGKRRRFSSLGNRRCNLSQVSVVKCFGPTD